MGYCANKTLWYFYTFPTKTHNERNGSATSERNKQISKSPEGRQRRQRIYALESSDET